jgi:hypothetical protein
LFSFAIPTPDFTSRFNPRQSRATFSPNPPNLADLPFQNSPFVEILPVAPARLPANSRFPMLPNSPILADLSDPHGFIEIIVGQGRVQDRVPLPA